METILTNFRQSLKIKLCFQCLAVPKYTSSILFLLSLNGFLVPLGYFLPIADLHLVQCGFFNNCPNYHKKQKKCT